MLGERIKELRLQRNWPQKTLAMELGVDRSTVAYWETGHTSPSLERLKQISLLFEVSADYLLDLPNRYRLVIVKKSRPHRNPDGEESPENP